MSMNNDKKIETRENEKYSRTTRTRSARKRGKFNFVDACLMLCLLAVVFVVISYFLPGITSYFTKNEEYTVIYKIEFRGVDSDIDMSNITDGMNVYDTINNYEIGTVKGKISVEPHMILANSGEQDKNGDFEGTLVAHPKLKNIVVTIEGKAIYSADDESFLINGQRIAVGREFNVRMGGFTGVGYCVSFDPYAH